MYHNDKADTVEIPDGININSAKAKVVMIDGKLMLILGAELSQTKEFGDGPSAMRLHLTNGINHHYVPLEVQSSSSVAELEQVVEEEEHKKKGKK